MPNYHEFDQTKFENAIDAVKRHGEVVEQLRGDTPFAKADSGEYAVTAECISLEIDNNQVCLNIPIYGKICIPLPVHIPDGTAAEACLSICSTWGVPHGVKVTVSVAGHVVVSKTFGVC